MYASTENRKHTFSLAHQWQSPHYQTISLNEKERGKLIQGLKTVSGELLFQRFVDHLPEEPHLQQFQEDELDSSEGQMKVVSTGIAKTFIILYKNWQRD